MEKINLIDFHCHLDLYPDHQKIIEMCELQKIRTLAVTTTPRAWTRNRDLTKNTKYVRAALGLHPQLVGKTSSKELLLWEEFLPEAKYIGEVGIDAGPNFVHSLKEQVKIFTHILQLCSNVEGRIISVHSVRSAGMVLDLIESNLPSHKGTVILHWFTGSLNEAQKAVKLGCYFSINSSMLQTKKGQELLERIPAERILTETDGPFVEFNGKPSKPSDVIYTLQLIAKLFKRTPDEISNLLNSNLKYLLNNSLSENLL